MLPKEVKSANGCGPGVGEFLADDIFEFDTKLFDFSVGELVESEWNDLRWAFVDRLEN
jgi:hypothetical protein